MALVWLSHELSMTLPWLYHDFGMEEVRLNLGEGRAVFSIKRNPPCRQAGWAL